MLPFTYHSPTDLCCVALCQEVLGACADSYVSMRSALLPFHVLYACGGNLPHHNTEDVQACQGEYHQPHECSLILIAHPPADCDE